MQFSRRVQGYSGSAYGKLQSSVDRLRAIAAELAASGKLTSQGKPKKYAADEGR